MAIVFLWKNGTPLGKGPQRAKSPRPCPFERFKSLNSQHCWQYEVRLQNRLGDLEAIGRDEEWTKSLSMSDFDFMYVPKEDKESCRELTSFIERHEFLGNIPNRPTHRFAARLKKTGFLAGVIIMATPNAFSHILGKEYKNVVKLVARGASISWSPKNLGSWLLSRATKWMIHNTEFRCFEAYSDPLAKELGTIYQALNWTYLGQSSGSKLLYRDPNDANKKWFSDREFRKRSKYRRYAESLGMSRDVWDSYMGKYSPQWDRIPPDIKTAVKHEESKYRESCESRTVPPKHKYCYIRGRTRKETKHLTRLFEDNNPTLVRLKYPTNRGSFS